VVNKRDLRREPMGYSTIKSRGPPLTARQLMSTKPEGGGVGIWHIYIFFYERAGGCRKNAERHLRIARVAEPHRLERAPRATF
jgi:hypothetical protein